MTVSFSKSKNVAHQWIEYRLTSYPNVAAKLASQLWHSHYFNYGQGTREITSEAALEAAITEAGGIALVARPAVAHTDSSEYVFHGPFLLHLRV